MRVKSMNLLYFANDDIWIECIYSIFIYNCPDITS